MENENQELAGSLEDSKVPDLIFRIAQSEATGILYLTKGQIQKALYFNRGKLVFAKSNSIDDRLGEQLLKEKKITYAQLIEAGNLITPSKRLGTVLVEKNLITPDELVQTIIEQIKGIIFGVFQWTEGLYLFELGPLTSKEVIILTIPVEEIIIQGINRIESWSWISHAVGPLDTAYIVSSRYILMDEPLSLPRLQLDIAEFLNVEHTVQEVCEFSTIGDFDTYKTLWALLVLGVIEKLTVQVSIGEKEPFGEVQVEASIEEQPQQQEEALIYREGTMHEEIVQHPATTVIKEEEQSELTEKKLHEQQAKNTTSSNEIINASVNPPILEISFSDLSEFTEEEEEEEWKPPEEQLEEKNASITQEPEFKEEDIAFIIVSYNSKYRYIYELVRLELGYLANEFYATAINKAKMDNSLLFDSIKYDEFGSLEVQSLVNNIRGNLINDYQKGLDAFLEIQIQMMEKFLEPSRVAEIKNMLEKI